MLWERKLCNFCSATRHRLHPLVPSVLITGLGRFICDHLAEASIALEGSAGTLFCVQTRDRQQLDLGGFWAVGGAECWQEGVSLKGISCFVSSVHGG